jgi:hypothetical protein
VPWKSILVAFQDEAQEAAHQLSDICHLIIAQSSARLSSAGTASTQTAASQTQSPAALLLTSLIAVKRVTAAQRPILDADDLENLTVLIHNTLQQASSCR